MRLNLKVLDYTFAICRLPSTAKVPDWPYQGSFYSITKTLDELSIVCSQQFVTDMEKVDKDWKIIKVEGPLDFSLIGIMANLSSTLASGGISIFTISTFDTDYILVKEKNLKEAIDLLSKAGHKIS